MRVIINNNYDECSVWAANYVAYRIKSFRPSAKKPFILGLCTGSTPLGMYNELIKMYKAGKISFENVVTFNMDEYIGLGPKDPQSYHYFMHENFFKHVNIPQANIHLLNGQTKDFTKECNHYEEMIKSYGKIHLFVGGVGSDGHIAFNEPGSALTSRTRVKTLASETVIANSRFFETASVSFANTFTPKDTAAQITVEKDLQNLCGKPMGLDGFRFQLTDAAGNKTEVVSDAEGLAKFTLTFTAADAGKTFVYKLTEVDTEVKDVQYSDAEYEVKIAVTKDAVTGELSTAVTVTCDGKAHQGNPVFVNYYDQDTTPETGDASVVAEMGLCMGISGAALLAVLVLGKKKRFAAE